MVATPILHMYKKSSQDYHTKSKDNKNLPHTNIQHAQRDPFKGNMKLRTSYYLFLYYLVLLPNKLLEHCFHNGSYVIHSSKHRSVCVVDKLLH